jgi:predicted nucleic acid-binding protein
MQMNYLEDTCVFLHKIIEPNKVFKIADFCKKKGQEFSITDIVLNEMRTGSNANEDEKSIRTGMANSIELCSKSNLAVIIDVQNNEKFKENFQKIRKRYYTHVTDIRYIKSKIDSGELPREKAKGIKYKDSGECSCIAVAMEHPKDYIIVSEDIGRVFLKPNINLFNIYGNKYKFSVWNYDTWEKRTEFNEYENQKTIL